MFKLAPGSHLTYIDSNREKYTDTSSLRLTEEFRDRKFESWFGHITFMEIHYEIMVILSFPLFQERLLTITGKSIGTNYWLST